MICFCHNVNLNIYFLLNVNITLLYLIFLELNQYKYNICFIGFVGLHYFKLL